jgi:hypothetical protein
MRALAATATAGALLLVAGCGSSSGGWKVVSKRTTSGSALGVVAGTVHHPAALQVKIDAKPEIPTQVNYSIDCASGLHPATGVLNGRTPFTAPISLPASNPDTCSVNVTASKPMAADLTVTLLVREAS